jgi:hypothetical protein
MRVAEQGKRPGLIQQRPHGLESARRLLSEGDGLSGITADQSELAQPQP